MSRQAINLGAPLREVDQKQPMNLQEKQEMRIYGIPKALIAEFKHRKELGLEFGSFSQFVVKSAMKQAEDWR